MISFIDKIDILFGVSGSGSSKRMIADAESIGIPYYPVYHESAAAIMAGAASLNSKMGASICIKGPGLTNMIPGIANNYFEHRPAISISESYGYDSLGYHKRISHYEMLKPLVKAHLSLSSNLDRLLQVSLSEPCGPVHLDLANNVRDYSCDTMEKFDPVDLTHARHPIVFLGGACRRSGQDFSHIKVPIFTTATGKGVIDETLPQCAGIFTGCGAQYSAESLVDQSDLLISIQIYDHEWLKKPNVINISIEDTPLLTSILDNKQWGYDEIKKLQNLLNQYNRHEWLPYQCFDILNQLHWDHDMIVDVGLFSVVAEHIWRSSPKRRFFGSLNSRYMGSSIPTLIGMQFFNPRPIICVVGDGGIAQYFLELQLIAQSQSPVCIILMSDGKYGSIPTAKTPSTPAIQSFSSIGMDIHEVTNVSIFENRIKSWNKTHPIVLVCKFDAEIYKGMTCKLRN